MTVLSACGFIDSNDCTFHCICSVADIMTSAPNVTLFEVIAKWFIELVHSPIITLTEYGEYN